ncbi:hypothetical protein I7I51_04701 [Histoplasma capsulatum]|uniref:Uncharacterized protein n=1 Tax=Ajellomyces capsulatus TaxID=5037 RepID=A0A8A1M2T2_AJECA|nr:hypothetical protein I7I51_04701 [Histoplasma capsulatum]
MGLVFSRAAWISKVSIWVVRRIGGGIKHFRYQRLLRCWLLQIWQEARVTGYIGEIVLPALVIRLFQDRYYCDTPANVGQGPLAVLFHHLTPSNPRFGLQVSRNCYISLVSRRITRDSPQAQGAHCSRVHYK